MERMITDDVLEELRERIKPYLKEKRYLHTLEVEAEAARIGALYLPEKIPQLRVSALLHDITKRLSFEKQLQCCEEFGIMVNTSDLLSPKVFHAMTARALAARDFPDVVDDEILSGIRWHTTGHDRMTVFESIIYLADFIEPSRTFDDCIALRSYFWGSMPEDGGTLALTVHLCSTMIYSFDLTIRNLTDSGEAIAVDTVLARNCFLDRLASLRQDR
ncbi:MAG: HD domain-containing protein [Eubacteriales bacterium]